MGYEVDHYSISSKTLLESVVIERELSKKARLFVYQSMSLPSTIFANCGK